MIKRGQIYGDLFKYFLIAVIAVMILLFGINAFNKVKNASCRSGLILLESKLKESVETVSSDVGSISEEVFKIPCDIDKIYFVDLEGDKTRLLNSLGEFPLIQDAIKEDIEKNAFLVKGNKVVESFYAGDIDLQKPYFVCSNTARGNLGVYLGGKGTSTELFNKECAYDCTFEVIDISEGIAEELIGDAINFSCQGCPKGTLVDEMDRFRETNKVVKIARRCNCGRKPGETVVEILIKPEGTLEHFKLIEKIPKDYVDNLDEFIKSVHGNYNYFKIKSDPLIMWHFNEISKETIIQYTIEKDILQYCTDVFKTVGLGVTTLSEGLSTTTPETKLDKIEDDPPILNLPDDVIEIKKGQSNNNVFNKPVWHFVSDPDLISKKEEKEAKFKDYIYYISMDGANYLDAFAIYNPTASEKDYISCLIESSSKNVKCEVGAEFSETFHTFYINVTDTTGKSAVGKLKITVFDCSNLDETQCGQKPSECKWCPKCDIDNKWSGYANNMCVNKGACSYGDGTDIDGDGFSLQCDKDCDDNNKFVNLSSTNPYCDCNMSTGGGATSGTEETGALCSDSADNDCDGNIDNCYYKLECTKLAESGCVWDFSDECYDHSRGWRTGSCYYRFKDEYICYDDWETECMENPVCVGGIPISGLISCVPTCTDNDGDGYSIEGGACGEVDCDDNNIHINPGATEVCNDGINNNCDSDVDCDDNDCSSYPACLTCQLTSAYWDGTFIEIKDWFGIYRMASVNDVSTVTLTVKGSNGCNGKTVNFEVWEYDYIFGKDKQMSLDQDTSIFNTCDISGCIATTTWDAVWEEDTYPLIATPDPEYLFKAIVASEDEITSKDNGDGNPEILEVIE